MLTWGEITEEQKVDVSKEARNIPAFTAIISLTVALLFSILFIRTKNEQQEVTL